MKKIIILLATIFIISCEHKDGCESIFLKYYIGCYVEGDIEFKISTNILDNKVYLVKYNNNKPSTYQTYYSPEYYKDLPSYEKFLYIANRNGDNYFNHFDIDVYYQTRMASALDFESIHITSDVDWDEAHPAGTNLDDLIILKATTYAEFIRSGYKTGNPDGRTFKIPMNTVTTADLAMLDGHGGLCFFRFTTVPPDARMQKLTVTMTSTEGEVKTASLYCVPQVFPDRSAE